MKAIIITGDRHASWDQWSTTVTHVIANVQPAIIIHGACGIEATNWQGKMRGIDMIAHYCQRPHNTRVIPMPAPFKREGTAGGPRRNKAMLTLLQQLQFVGYDVEVHAFHDNLNGSRGTKDMVNQARHAHITVFIHTTGA